ncbi:hypothetical protein ACIBL8_44220 [Streptomyces sp. NPDC050523]|uniref:hypothetical protein n=1 Tax=Streptomyces sp. NPDC050523 TaxID=3365622 RepID=UPI00378B7781
MTRTTWEWRDEGSGGPGHLQRISASGVYSRTQTTYRAYIDHVRDCLTCAVDSAQCSTAEGLWAAYRAATS